MSEKTITAFVTVALAIIGVAVIAVLVSANATTGNVISSGGSAFSQLLCTVLSPLTGKKCSGATSVTSSVRFPQ